MPGRRSDVCEKRAIKVVAKTTNKKNSMKTRIIKAARITGLAAGLLLLGSLAGEVRADGAKGGATQLMRPSPAPAATEYTAMSCPKCTSEWVTRAEVTTKGTTPITATYERHGCNGCATTIATSGFGKAKTEVTSHKCSGCGAESVACCNTKKTIDVATKGMEKKTFEIAPVK